VTDHDTLRGADAGDPPSAVPGRDDSVPLYPEVALHPEVVMRDDTPHAAPPPGTPPPAEVPPDGDDDPQPTPAERRRSFWKVLPFLILIALVVAVLIKTFLVQAFWIPSGSMEDTLQINDRVLVSKLSYRFGDISRGDVVVFDDPRGVQTAESVPEAVWRNLLESVGLSTPKSEYIKRVIGLPGETVQVRGGKVEIDGVPIDEPWLHPFTTMPDFGPETIAPGFLFVMGDNRNASQDSRVFGPIDDDTVVGRAFVVLWPPSRWSGL
jgi:signal peptidase I